MLDGLTEPLRSLRIQTLVKGLLKDVHCIIHLVSHEDPGHLDEYRGAEDVEPLLQTLQAQLHFIVAALHLHQVEGQHADLLHLHHHSLLGVFVEGVISSPAPYKTKTAFVDLKEARQVGSIRVSRMELM